MESEFDLGFDEKAEQERKQNHEKLMEDYAHVFCKSESGLRVLNHILEKSGVFDRDFIGSSRDAFRAGKRDLGLMVFYNCGYNGLMGLIKLAADNKKLHEQTKDGGR